MNTLQRIILVVGAIVLAVVLYMTPRYVAYNPMGLRIKMGRDAEEWALGTKDTGRAAINGCVVLGVTGLLCFAAKSRRKE